MFRSLAVSFHLICVLPSLLGQMSQNISLVGQANRGDNRYSGSWAYVAPDGTEYALIGAHTGTAAYCITDNCDLEERGFVPGPTTNWREITVIGQHAFVTTDVSGTDNGMQVIDLGYLPDSLHLVTNYTTTFTKGHIIQKAVDSDEPYVYVMGTTTTQGIHILDVSNPAAPLEIGLYAPGYYIHDAHVRGSLMFAAAFYETKMDIVDISDKANPMLVGTIVYEGKNTHSSSSTEDGRYLIVADERDGFPARIFNIEEVGNAYEVARYTANDSSLVHNPYILGDFCFVSHNTEGLRVLDIADPTVPVEVGFYDTWPGQSGGFSGLWSACPYFPSGKIIGGNRTDGLYVWEFNGTKAGRVYGVVKDSLTGNVIFNASVVVTELQDTLDTGLTGRFRTGMLEGDYHILVEKNGYVAKSLEINILEADSQYFEVLLVPDGFTSTFDKSVGLHKVNVFPNPSSTGFQVDLGDLAGADFYKIYDEKGVVLAQSPILDRQRFALNLGEKAARQLLLAIFDRKGTLIATARLSAF